MAGREFFNLFESATVLPIERGPNDSATKRANSKYLIRADMCYAQTITFHF